jgi:D-glycero-D-manno-heptose 1,7-bisphosphate phosphatase
MVKRRCVFLDRDGVINVKAAPGEYISRWPEFRFLSGIVNWIRLFKALDFLVIVVTNQRGVARGLIGPTDLEEIHRRMCEELEQAGAALDGVLCCPHEEGACTCRKPLPGLVFDAEERWNIDLRSSLLIGDSDTDRQLAQTCDMAFALVRNEHIVDVIPRPGAQKP